MNGQNETPLIDILDLFTAPTVPARGADEEEIDPPVWQVGTSPATSSKLK